MTLFDIALVKVEILFAEAWFCRAYLQVGIAFENALLLTVGGELSYRDACGTHALQF